LLRSQSLCREDYQSFLHSIQTFIYGVIIFAPFIGR
jgi:hypothetical protein